MLVAQERHDVTQVEQAVKVGAANMHAGGGQNIAGTLGVFAVLRVELDNGKVRRAPANVHHQHRGLFRDALLEVKRSSNRLQLKVDVGETGLQGGAAQRGLGQVVALAVVVHKMHRAAQHGAGNGLTQVRLAASFEFFEEQHHDVKKTDRLAVHHGLLVHQFAAQQALDGAHQTPLFAAQVGLHGLAAKERAVGFVAKKQGGGHGGFEAVQRHHAQLAVRINQGGGGVGGAEVDPENGLKKFSFQSLKPRPCCVPKRGSERLKYQPLHADARCAAWGRCAIAPGNPAR